MLRDETPHPTVPPSQPNEPAWEVATLFPVQGHWTEDDFFALETSHLVELAEGHIEVLPMPTWLHQLIVKYLSQQLEAWVNQHGDGVVLFAPLPVRLSEKTIREPDVLYLRPENIPSDVRGYPVTADLVMEVVGDSPNDRHRDMETKRAEYARAGVSEYWIVDPLEKQITVLTLAGAEYRVHGEFGAGQQASSEFLPDFTINASSVWALEENEPTSRS